MRIYILILCIIFFSCSRMRWEFAKSDFFWPKKRGVQKNTTSYPDGKIKIIIRRKFVVPKHVIDAAGYSKTHIRYYYTNGKIESDSLEENIGSVWSYEIAITHKEYDSNGKMTDYGRYSKKSGW